MFKIEKNVPVTKSQSGKNRKVIYPWRQMESGDSFFVDNIDKTKSSSIQALGIKYLPDNLKPVSRKEGNGRRFWAIEK